MADYHIFKMAKDRKTIEVVFHIQITGTGRNQADIQWRDAVVMEQGGVSKISSKLPSVSLQDKADMESGTILEVRKTLRFSSIDLTNAERQAEVEAEYNRIKLSVVAEKLNTLAFIGLEGMVK